MRIQNKKHGIYRVNGGKEYKASRLGGLERVRGGENVITVQADSQGHVLYYHELMSRVLPVGR